MKCLADYIEERIKQTPDGGVCSLPKDEYYIERHINIKSRKNITVDGNGSVIVSHYNNGNSEKPTSDVFHIFGCKGVKLCNFVFETDTPVNITGTVESIDTENNSYILSVLPDFKVTGKEIFMTQNTYDDDGSIDTIIDHYCICQDNKNRVTLLAGEIILANTHCGEKYDYLGNGKYNVFLPANWMKRLVIGQKMCIRHSAYGPVSILIKNSDDTAIENVTIHSAGGMGIIVLPRSENLYLKNYNVVLPESSKQMMSCNCDGIHIAGLCGKLTMKNCDFSGLGDDALNIHSTAATVTAADTETGVIKCNYCKKSQDGILSPDWCRKGDIITVLNPETCNKTGEFKVKSFEHDKLTFEALKGEIKSGFVLQNTAFAAAVEIKDCNIRNTKARAFVLQTENIEISDCSFYGTPSPAILAAFDLKPWYEVGPIKNMKIHNNTFSKCGFASEDRPIIAVKNSHSRNYDIGVPGVHENIEIAENVFKGKVGRCIFVTSTNGLKIGNNEFADCKIGDSFIECPACGGTEIKY